MQSSFLVVDNNASSMVLAQVTCTSYDCCLLSTKTDVLPELAIIFLQPAWLPAAIVESQAAPAMLKRQAAAAAHRATQQQQQLMGSPALAAKPRCPAAAQQQCWGLRMRWSCFLAAAMLMEV
jgi:hypothetical protein